MEKSSINLEMIYQALPFVARTTGGVAKVTDQSGLCLYAVGPDGDRREILKAPLANSAGRRPKSKSPRGAVKGRLGGKRSQFPWATMC